jgi:histidine triad (HIT) family protein
MSEETIFSKIIRGDIPSDKVYEDDKVLAFNDISPMAKVHVLFIHKTTTKHVNQMVQEHPQQLVDIYQAIAKYTQESGLDKSGFRVVTNMNKDAGQTVFHTHMHVLGGERLGTFGS